MKATHQERNPGVLDRAPLSPTTHENDPARLQDIGLLDAHDTDDIHLTRHLPSHLDVHTDDFGLPYSHTTSS